MEEIYDRLLEAKKTKNESARCLNVLDKIDIDDDRPYFRMTSSVMIDDKEIEK